MAQRPEGEDIDGRLFDSAEEFPDLGSEQGMWIHPKESKFCLRIEGPREDRAVPLTGLRLSERDPRGSVAAS